LNTYRLFNNGVKYTALPEECFVFDAREEAACRTTLKVTLPKADPGDDTVPDTTEIVIIDARSDTRCLEHLIELADVVGNLKESGNCRPKEKTDGNMSAIGWRNYEGKVVYKPTKRPSVSLSLKRVAREIACQMRLYCPEFWDTFSPFNISDGGRDPLLGGAFGVGQQVMLSANLGNAAHIDVNDKSRTYAVFCQNRFCPEVKGWYLLFPTLSYKGSNGIAIRLYHGAAVSWDGRILRHCTTIATTLDGTRVADLPVS
jgi:hypothetical protein